MKNAITFLKRIKKNNNTPWMHAHKDEYLVAKEEVEFFAKELMAKIIQFDDRMPLMEPKECMFRFNRDIRFSDNKKPYKENFGIYFSYAGKKSDLPGYYVNISPTEVFVAGGLWMPEPENLIKLRRHIVTDGDSLQAVLDDKKFKNTFGELSRDNALVRPPKGFPADHEHVELLKLKSFTASVAMAPADVVKPDFAKKVGAHMKTLMPLTRHLLKVLD